MMKYMHAIRFGNNNYFFVKIFVEISEGSRGDNATPEAFWPFRVERCAIGAKDINSLLDR